MTAKQSEMVEKLAHAIRRAEHAHCCAGAALDDVCALPLSAASLAVARLALGAAYEQCAAICEEQAAGFLSPEYATGQPLSSFHERFACNQCAHTIRQAAIDAALTAEEPS